MIPALTRLHPLYEVKLIQDSKAHFYQIGNDEQWKPGVTTVLGILNKPALLPWAVKTCSDNIREYLMKNAIDKTLTVEEIDKACLEGKNIYKKKAAEAADIGTRVHYAINELIHGRSIDMGQMDIRPGIDGFLSWKASQGLQIELGDTKIGSKLFGYGGSLDFVAFDKDGPIIFDNKTTKKRRDKPHGIYDEYAMQLAAYAQAFKETFGLPVKNVYALWLNKEKAEFQAVRVSNLSAAFEAFLACLKIYQTQKFELFENTIQGETR